jgi:hypothetical protein
MPERKVPRLVRQAVAVAAVVALAFPPGTVAALTWLANHDMVDVPYVRDCHGLFRHPQECRRAEAAGQ